MATRPNQLGLFDSVAADNEAALEAFYAESPCVARLVEEPVQRKATNPKDAVGVRKAPISTVSGPVMAEVGVAMLEGARKYGRHNYRVSGVRASVYYDAAWRHFQQWWEGEDIDPDSGLHHLAKAAACIMVMRDSIIQGNWVDDRPPPSPAGWLESLNAAAGAIIDRLPDAREAHTAR